MIKLEQYFSGEDKWNNYSECFKNEWNNDSFQLELLKKMKNKVDIARVIYFHNRKQSLVWINSEIPILDGLTPLECMENEDLTKRLKTCLMRFPI